MPEPSETERSKSEPSKSEPSKSETTTAIRTLLADLVRAALMSDDRASVRWREAARRGQSGLAADPARVEGLNVEGFWTLAVREAEAPEFRAAENQVQFGFPALCPFSLDEITDSAFDVDRAVERLRKSAATG